MRSSWIVASMLLGIALLVRVAPAQQIGVARVGEVLTNMAEGKKAAQAGAAREADAKQHGAQLAQEIQSLQGQMHQLKIGSAQYNDLRDQVEDRQTAYELWAKKTERTLSRAAKEELRLMFLHVTEATQQIAQERHLTLVVNDTAPEVEPSADQLTVQQFGSVLAQRTVVFADKSVDITQAVLARVEANYAKQNQAEASQPIGSK